MKNDGYVKVNDVMPYLLNNLAYWGREDVYTALEKMPIESANSKMQLKKRYIKKSNIMYFLVKYLVYWGADDVSQMLNRMPTISGLMVKFVLICNKRIA